MTVTIRPAHEDDTLEWRRMRVLLWPASQDEHAPDIARYFVDKDPEQLTLVADRGDGSLCGFLEAGTRLYAEGCLSSPVGYIEGWWVDPTVRRKGIGGLLILAAEEWARALGMKEMGSDTPTANRTSLAAHLALGYREEERLICFRKIL